MRLLSFLRKRHRLTRKSPMEEWTEESHYPYVTSSEPCALISQAPAPEPGMSIMLYVSIYRGAAFYCSRDVFRDVLRANLAERDLRRSHARSRLKGVDDHPEGARLVESLLGRSNAESLLEWVDDHPEGALLITPPPPDLLVERNPEFVFELPNGHTHWDSPERVIRGLLEGQHPYEVHCLHCRRTYEGRAVLVGQWYHRFGRDYHEGRAFMCPERHPLWSVTDLTAS